MSDDLRMLAYYYGFEATGVEAVDRILSAVAVAGKGSHHTESWEENGYIHAIQVAANDAAEAFQVREAAERKRKIIADLREALDAKFDDGGSILEYIFLTDPELKRNLFRVLFGEMK